MPSYTYRGMAIGIPEFDHEHRGYFEHAAQGELVVKRCSDCGKLRWPPGPACPFCTSLQWAWQPVSGRGTIFSYEIVTQAIQPGFAGWVPYPVVLVELDERASENQALRILMNLLDAEMEPERSQNVAIGKRVEVVFMEAAEGFFLPQARLSNEQPRGTVWQSPNNVG